MDKIIYKIPRDQFKTIPNIIDLAVYRLKVLPHIDVWYEWTCKHDRVKNIISWISGDLLRETDGFVIAAPSSITSRFVTISRLPEDCVYFVIESPTKFSLRWDHYDDENKDERPVLDIWAMEQDELLDFRLKPKSAWSAYSGGLTLVRNLLKNISPEVIVEFNVNLM